MEITLEPIGPSAKLCKVLIPAVRVAAAFDAYYARLAPNAKVSGFRSGKVPRHVLEKNFHQQAKDDVINHIIPEAYQEIMAEKQLRPALKPMILKVDWKLDDSLYFEAQVDLIPQITLPAYKGIAVEIRQREITDKDVAASIEHLRVGIAQLVPLTGRGLRVGDVVILDQKVSVGEQVLEDLKDVTYELDEKRLSPEVYRGLLDARAGDNKTVSTTIPEHYPKKEFIGKPATVALAVKEVKEKKLPEVNDEFAKDVGEYQSLDDLKGKIREGLVKGMKDFVRAQTESKINEFLVQNTAMELPERLIQRQVKHSHEKAVEERQAPEKPDEAYWKALAAGAVNQLKLYFTYLRIAEEEKIIPGDAEVEAKVAEIARKIGQSPSVLMQYYRKEDRLHDVKERITQNKVAEFLISQANVKTSTA